MGWRCGIALSLGVALAASPIAEAFVPSAERILRAVAEANADGKRTSALQFDLTMRIGEGTPVAHGELLTLPAGAARLELRGTDSRVERHLLRGAAYRVSRNGRRVSEPQFLLPPLFVLQVSSEPRLHADLAALGIDSSVVALAACGQGDCFVFGDASRAAPPLEEPSEETPEAAAEEVEPPVLAPHRPDSEAVPALPPPTLWVDSESFDARRIRTRRNVRVEFGPYVNFGVVRAPSWLRVDEPGHKPVRFDIQKVIKVAISESAMTEGWLSEPLPPRPEPSAGAGPPSGSWDPESR